MTTSFEYFIKLGRPIAGPIAEASKLMQMLGTTSLLWPINITATLFVASAAALVCYLCMHRWLQRDSKDPRTWPIIGTQLEASKNYERLVDWMTQYFRDDHRTVKMSSLSRSSFLTVDPANVEYILKGNFQNFPKGEEFHNRLFDMLGNGILNTDGKVWRSQRKLASLEFSIKRLRTLSSTVYRKGALKLLEALATSNQGVDIQDMILTMTFGSICEVVFGGEIERLPDSLPFSNSSIASAFDNVQEMTTRRYVFPWWRVQRFINIGSERILRQENFKLNYFLSKIIKDRKLQIEEDYDGSKYLDKQDLLSHFIFQQTKGGGETLFSNEDLRDVMMSFMMAGRDTTASTLSWFIYCMCAHQDKQNRLFEELLSMDQNDYNGDNHSNSGKISRFKEYAERMLTYENLQNKMHYLHAALTETLRLYPAVPWDGKMTLRDDVLPDGTKVKAGDQVAYFPYAMGRMKFLWGQDALEFKPERWLHNGIFQPQSPFKFTAFQAGPRMCLGRDAAYLQMKITAAMLLRFFHFELVPNHLVKYKMMMVMSMKHGLKVNISSR